MEEKGLILVQSDPLSESNPDPDGSFLFPIYEMGDFTKLILRKCRIKPFVLISTKEARASSQEELFFVLVPIQY